jgi:hypothetical protein
MTRNKPKRRQTSDKCGCEWLTSGQRRPKKTQFDSKFELSGLPSFRIAKRQMTSKKNASSFVCKMSNLRLFVSVVNKNRELLRFFCYKLRLEFFCFSLGRRKCKFVARMSSGFCEEEIVHALASYKFNYIAPNLETAHKQTLNMAEI